MRRLRLEGLWRDREFLKLWSGESVSLIGAQVGTLALPLAAVYELHASAQQLGFLNAASYAPFLLASLVIGVWVDRHRRRPLMIWSNIGRAVVFASIPLCAALDILQLAYLYAAALVVGTLTVLFDVAYQSYLPSLIGRDHLVEGNSKLQASSSVAQIGGPGLAGVLVGWLTAPVAMLVNAGAWLVSTASLLAIRHREPAPAPPAERTSLGRSVTEGLRLVLGDSLLRNCALHSGTYNMCWLSLQTVFVVYAARSLGLAPHTIGLVLGVGAVGSLIGAMSAQWMKRRLGLGPAIIVAGVICCALPLLIPAAPGRGPLALVLFVLAFAGCGLGGTVATVHMVSLRQAITPAAMLGRVNSGCRFLSWGPLPLGGVAGGYLSDALGPRTALVITGIGFLFALLWLAFSPVPRLKDFPEPPLTEQPRAASQL
ncbi:MFS transporter [Streptomyces sp. NPDC052682]|uniref:MFS transporter n=1 Tax=Streptomyces sp. NPDC052682 TaxID=3154954 RepID=UPI00342CECBD